MGERAGLEAVAGLSLEAFVGRVWCAWGMGASVRADGTVNVGWGVEEHGYRRHFGPVHVRPVLDRGFRRVVVWRPFSDKPVSAGEVFNEDAAVEAIAPATRDFAAMVRDFGASHPDVDFLAYLGSWADPSYGRQLRGGRFTAWARRRLAALAGLLDCANCDIGYDHAATMKPGYVAAGMPAWGWEVSLAFLQMVLALKRQQGAAVWIESVPARAAAWQHGMDFICSAFEYAGSRRVEWVRSRPADDVLGGYADSADVAPSQLLTGRGLEYNRWIGRHSIEEYAREIAGVLARGPRWQWAGALFYTPFSAVEVHQAVVRRAEALLAGDR